MALSDYYRCNMDTLQKLVQSNLGSAHMKSFVRDSLFGTEEVKLDADSPAEDSPPVSREGAAHLFGTTARVPFAAARQDSFR